MSTCVDCGESVDNYDMADKFLCSKCHSTMVKTWALLDDALDRLGL